MAQSKFPGTPLRDLTVIVDYSNRKLVLDVEHYNEERDRQGDTPDDTAQDGFDRRDQTFVGIAETVLSENNVNYPKPANAFGMMLVKMRQGSMSSHVCVTKGLLVPDDDDLRPAMPASTGGLRIQGEDPDGNLLETTWDEFDETLYRMEAFGGGDPSSDIPLCSFDHLISI